MRTRPRCLLINFQVALDWIVQLGSKKIRFKINKNNKQKEEENMKTISKILITIICGSFLLIGCGGGDNNGNAKGKGTRQDIDHANIAILFSNMLNQVLGDKGRRHNLVLVKKWTKQTGYAVYYDRNTNEYVAVNFNNFMESYYSDDSYKRGNSQGTRYLIYKRIIGGYPDLDSYYRENSVVNLVRSEGKSEADFYITRKNNNYTQHSINDYVYTDSNTGREYSDLKDTYSYYTGMELGFMEESKVEKFSEILRTQFNVSEDKTSVIAELAIEFANLDPDSLDRETTNRYAQKIIGVSFDEVEKATATDPIGLAKLFGKVATHMGIPTQNVYNLMGLFFLQ